MCHEGCGGHDAAVAVVESDCDDAWNGVGVGVVVGCKDTAGWGVFAVAGFSG